MKLFIKMISAVFLGLLCYSMSVIVYRSIKLSNILDLLETADYVVCPQDKQHVIVLNPSMKATMQNMMRKGTRVLLRDKKSVFYGDIIFKRNDDTEILRMSIMSPPNSYFNGIPVELDYNIVDLLDVNLHAYQKNKHRMP